MSSLDDFAVRRTLALELLTNHPERLSVKAGQFCGQVAINPLPLTDAQAEWLNGLALRAGLSEIAQ